METKNQIQLLQSQIINIKMQIDNLDILTNNMLNVNLFQIGEQLFNLSINLLNTGIQAFTAGKNINVYYIKYSEQLFIISQQINSLINGNNIIQQNPMMIQPMMMAPPLMIQPNQNLNKPEIYNIIFKTTDGLKKTILTQEGMTIKELIYKFIDSIKDRYSGYQINKMKFFSERSSIGNLYRNDDKRRVNSDFRNVTIWFE